MIILRNSFIGLLLSVACIGCVVVEETGPVVVRERGPIVVQEPYVQQETHVHYFRFKSRHHHEHDRKTVVVVPRNNVTHQSQGRAGGPSRQVVVTPGSRVQQNRARSAPAPVVRRFHGPAVIRSSGPHQSQAPAVSSEVQQSQGASSPAVTVQ